MYKDQKISHLRRELHKKIVQSKKLLPEGRLMHLHNQIKRIERILSEEAA